MKKTVVAVFVLGLAFMTLLPFFYEDEVSVVQNRIGLEEEQENSAQFAPLPILPSPYKRTFGKKPLFASLRKSLKKAFTAKAFKETQYDEYGTQEQDSPRQDIASAASEEAFDSYDFYEEGSYGRDSAYDHAATRRRPGASSAAGAEDDEYIQQEPSQGVPVKGIHNISTDEKAQQIFDSSKIHEEIMSRVQNSSQGQASQEPFSADGAYDGEDASPFSYNGKTGGNTSAFGSDDDDSFDSEGGGVLSSYRGGGRTSGFSGVSSSAAAGDGDIPQISEQFETSVIQTEEVARNHESYFKDLKDDMHEQMRENSTPYNNEKDGRPPLKKPKEYDPSQWQKIPDMVSSCGSEEEKAPAKDEQNDDIIKDISEGCGGSPDETKIRNKIETKKEIIINAGALEGGKFFVVAGENALGALAITAAGGAVKKIEEKDIINLSADKSKGKNMELPQLDKGKKKDLDDKSLIVVSSATYKEWSKDKNYLILTLDEAENKRNINSVLIKPKEGDNFSTYSGLNRIGEKINNTLKASGENENNKTGKKGSQAGEKENEKEGKAEAQ